MFRSRDIAKCEHKIVAILKIKDGRHSVFRKNVNITFQVQQVLIFPKMYSFANLPKIWTKLHKELD